MSSPRLLVRDLVVSYPAKPDLEVCQNIGFEIRAGEIVAIVGASGCGKSALLLAIAGLIKPSAGQVLFNGRSRVAGPGVAMMFQDYSLFPWMSACENVAIAVRGIVPPGLDGQRPREIAQELLRKLGLGPKEIRKPPTELSGGQRQRVAFAMALATAPELILLDEPFSAIDTITASSLRELLLASLTESRLTACIVTHDIEEALYLSDKVVILRGQPGRIQGIVRVPFTRPRQYSIVRSADFVALRWDILSNMRN